MHFIARENAIEALKPYSITHNGMQVYSRTQKELIVVNISNEKLPIK
jgi:hypothetical protein